MSEYEPIVGKQEFYSKWYKEGARRTEYSVQDVFQLSLDIFATRRGWDWRNVYKQSDEERLLHPDGRVFDVGFTLTKDIPLAPYIIAYPDEEAAEEFEHGRMHDFRRRAGGQILIFEGATDSKEEQRIELSPLACSSMYRDLMQAHMNTPFVTPPQRPAED